MNSNNQTWTTVRTCKRILPMDQGERPAPTLGLCVNTGLSGHKSVTALVAVAPGDSLIAFRGITLSEANRYTLQVGAYQHIMLEPEVLRYVNHSCDPNIVFDVPRMTVRAIRAIAPGD